MKLALLLALPNILLALGSPISPSRPHILLVLADDYGWNNIGYHRASTAPPTDPHTARQAAAEVHTPNLDALAAGGVKLERHYSYKICGPSRASLQSGRLAIHVNAENTSPVVHNPADPVSGYAGIPRNMTGLATKMREAGYRTAMVGKWDAGMATPEHSPQGRGYQEWYGYFQHSNHYWTKGTSLQSTGEVDLCFNRFTDLFEMNATYRGGVLDKAALSHSCEKDTQPDPKCYEESLFREKALSMIANHSTEADASPLFLFYAFHLLHTPLQVPLATLKQLDELVSSRGGNPIEDANRRLYGAMTLYMDQTVGMLVDALKAKQMWQNTVMIFLSDNGGPVYEPGAASNHPHRGGKYSDFEGGVRTNAFLSGGAVPAELSGSTFSGVISIADWYATLCHLGGVDPRDRAAEAANPWLESKGLPTLFPIDSVNQWPAIVSGANARPDAFPLSKETILEWPLKLVTGTQPYSLYTGPLFPNCTTVKNGAKDGPVFVDLKLFDTKLNYSSNPADQNRVTHTHDCGARGCLFNISADPSEAHDLAADSAYSDTLQRLQGVLSEVKVFEPDRGVMALAACDAGVQNGHYYGPFVEIQGFYTDLPTPSALQRVEDELFLKMVSRYNDTNTQQECIRKIQNYYSSPLVHEALAKSIDKCDNRTTYAREMGPLLSVQPRVNATSGHSFICDILP